MFTMSEEEKKVYIPSEAVRYLREKRGIIMSVGNLRQRRNRGTAKAKNVYDRTSLWTKEELDAIEPSPKTKRVPPSEG